MMELIQPYVTTLVTALIGLLVTLVLTTISAMKKALIPRLEKWLESKFSLTQRELIHKYAEEAFAYVEARFKDATSKEKFDIAYEQLYIVLNKTGHLDKLGLEISKREIESAIEKAVLDYNKYKQTIPEIVINDPEIMK
jgi:hypothetical protein